MVRDKGGFFPKVQIDFWPFAHVSGPTSNKLVVVGNVHTFKYGVIWKQL